MRRQMIIVKTPGVYFITGADLVKIGRVDATVRGGAENRLLALQSGSPVLLTLHRFVPHGWSLGLERFLHARYVKHRRHGEWFDDCVLSEIDGHTDAEICGWLRERVSRHGLQVDSNCVLPDQLKVP